MWNGGGGGGVFCEWADRGKGKIADEGHGGEGRGKGEPGGTQKRGRKATSTPLVGRRSKEENE